MNLIKDQQGKVKKEAIKTNINNNIDRWKRECKQRECKDYSTMSYWKLKSTCTQL